HFIFLNLIILRTNGSFLEINKILMVLQLTPVSQIAQHEWGFISLISQGWLETQASGSCDVCGGN
ncbi:MAG: hypothetical protein ACE1ZW_04185, partial [Nitrospirales bacterium]